MTQLFQPAPSGLPLVVPVTVLGANTAQISLYNGNLNFKYFKFLASLKANAGAGNVANATLNLSAPSSLNLSLAARTVTFGSPTSTEVLSGAALVGTSVSPIPVGTNASQAAENMLEIELFDTQRVIAGKQIRINSIYGNGVTSQVVKYEAFGTDQASNQWTNFILDITTFTFQSGGWYMAWGII